MKNIMGEGEVIAKLVQWGEERAPVRAMLLTSTRAKPDAPTDLFSDYDVILAVTEVRSFYEDRSWLGYFGQVLVLYRDPMRIDHGHERFAYITQYADSTKIDFAVCSAEILWRVAQDPVLPDELDVGYKVLLDKDRLADELRPPSYKAHVPKPPTQEVYQDLVENVFHEATYVAKHLWRDELVPAKYNLDYAIKHKGLRQMLEWRMEIDFDWSAKPGAYGKGLKRKLPSELWSRVEETYVGAGIEENWDALFRTLTLFHQVAVEVGDHLGLEYPHDLDRRATSYLQKVRNLDSRADSFG
jgi:aminoglycoside 6-adenylyltransferase